MEGKKFKKPLGEDSDWLAGQVDNHGSSIVITDSGVYNRAMFTCEVDLSRKNK